MKGFFLSVLLLVLFVNTGKSQSDEEKERNWTLGGYVKDLRTVFPIDGKGNLIVDNLFHNRLNFKWFPSHTFTTTVEVRSRIFYGELVKISPSSQFAKNIDTNNDFFDLSLILLEKNSMIVHTMIDRAYMEFVKGKLEVRVGRQRINWGINTVWNPNDLFNAYSFFDFDYEERPGTDAIRIQYYTGAASSIEFAIKAVHKFEDPVAAVLWKINKWKYDFQLLGGVTGRDLAAGGGWTGNIKNAGFKGEMTYFYNFSKLSSDPNSFASTVAFDYSFKNSMYLIISGLYNSNGENKLDSLNLLTFDINAKNLSPFQYTIFTQLGYPITPLLNSGLGIMYNPGDHSLFINPTFTISVKDNIDLDILTQVFFTNVADVYKAVGQLYFMRIKWSF